MRVVSATINGAISIVNAIATGKGAALGISKKVNVEIEASEGSGIIIESKNKQLSSRLINKVIEKIVPKNELSKTKFRVYLNSEIPTGYGLKSSSAISSAVAMGCAKLFKPKMNDFEILSVLRNLKVIGIFTRLADRDRKKRYLKLIPYAWKLIEHRINNNDVFKDLRKELEDNFPKKIRIKR